MNGFIILKESEVPMATDIYPVWSAADGTPDILKVFAPEDNSTSTTNDFMTELIMADETEPDIPVLVSYPPLKWWASWLNEFGLLLNL